MPNKDPKKIKEIRDKTYNKHKEHIKSKVKERRIMLREFISEIKTSRKCKICKEARSPCLVFHHRNPKDKEHEIADMASYGYAKEKILKEIEKCDVLCSNCHLWLHFG